MGFVVAEQSGYSAIAKILFLQVFVIIIVVSGFLVFGGEVMAISAILGGIVAFIPNLYFAYRMSRVKEQSAKKIVRSFYSGESRKILMTCLLFALAFQVPGVLFAPLMACFVAVLSVFWFALLLYAH